MEVLLRLILASVRHKKDLEFQGAIRAVALEYFENSQTFRNKLGLLVYDEQFTESLSNLYVEHENEDFRRLFEEH